MTARDLIALLQGVPGDAEVRMRMAGRMDEGRVAVVVVGTCDEWARPRGDDGTQVRVVLAEAFYERAIRTGYFEGKVVGDEGA